MHTIGPFNRDFDGDFFDLMSFYLDGNTLGIFDCDMLWLYDGDVLGLLDWHCDGVVIAFLHET